MSMREAFERARGNRLKKYETEISPQKQIKGLAEDWFTIRALELNPDDIKVVRARWIDLQPSLIAGELADATQLLQDFATSLKLTNDDDSVFDSVRLLSARLPWFIGNSVQGALVLPRRLTVGAQVFTGAILDLSRDLDKEPWLLGSYINDEVGTDYAKARLRHVIPATVQWLRAEQFTV